MERNTNQFKKETLNYVGGFYLTQFIFYEHRDYDGDDNLMGKHTQVL